MSASIKLVYTPFCQKQLQKLPPQIKKLIRIAIENLSNEPYSGKPLKEELEGFRSLKLNRYRIIYYLNETEKRIELLFAGHRSNIYQEFSQYIRQQTKKM